MVVLGCTMFNMLGTYIAAQLHTGAEVMYTDGGGGCHGSDVLR